MRWSGSAVVCRAVSGSGRFGAERGSREAARTAFVVVGWSRAQPGSLGREFTKAPLRGTRLRAGL